MFSKHVWHDRRHQAEVFINDDGEVSGTIVAYKGAVCLINPRPEILTALYQEAKIRRILAVRAVILTDSRMEFTRGLCALVGYSRGLRRRRPLEILTSTDVDISYDFLNSCCARLLGDTAPFDVEIRKLRNVQRHQVGDGAVCFVRLPASQRGGDANPYVVIETSERTMHYYDETHRGEFDDVHDARTARPHLVVRAQEMPSMTRRQAGDLIDAG